MSQILGATHHPTYDPAGSVVRVRDLCRTFTPDAGVLTGVDLDLRGGEVVGLVGRRGSGKSTLLRALARTDLDVPGSGTLRLPEVIVTLGEEPRLLGWRRVLDNVTAGLAGADALRRGRLALGEVGLDGRELAWPDDLTLEEQHRVALAHAIAQQPELILAEEPYRQLPALGQRALHRQLRAATERHGCAVLVVTNDVHEALTLTDRVVTLRDGRIHRDLTVRAPGAEAPIAEAYAALRAELLAELGLADGPDQAVPAPPAAATHRRETA